MAVAVCSRYCDVEVATRIALCGTHYKPLYRSFATTVSQLKMGDFSGETFQGFEVL